MKVWKVNVEETDYKEVTAAEGLKKRKKGRRIKDTAALSVAGFSEEDYSSSSSRWNLPASSACFWAGTGW